MNQPLNVGATSQDNMGTPGAANAGKNRWCKCCGICCGITVVVLGIMIPVGIYVIAPKVAQHLLDTSEIEISNSTMLTCGSPVAWLINTVSIKLDAPLPITSELHAFTQKLSTTTCNVDGQVAGGYACGENATVTALGNYTNPSMTLKNGKNHQAFEAAMELHLIDGFPAVVQGFVLPMQFGPPPLGNGPHGRAVLILEGEATVGVGPLKIPNLKMKKTLTCTGFTFDMALQHEIPNWVCHPGDDKHEPDSSSVYGMSCVPGELPLIFPGHPSTTTTTSRGTTTPTTTAASTTTTPKPDVVV
jgi:hypothetical protein